MVSSLDVCAIVNLVHVRKIVWNSCARFGSTLGGLVGCCSGFVRQQGVFDVLLV